MRVENAATSVENVSRARQGIPCSFLGMMLSDMPCVTDVNPLWRAIVLRRGPADLCLPAGQTKDVEIKCDPRR